MTLRPDAAPQPAQDDEVERLLESLDRLANREQQLTAEFYALFFTRHPETRELFGRHSLSEQEEMIRETLVSVVAWVEQEAWLQANLEAMGRSHADYGVEDRMYDWLVECMVDALARVLGADWRDAYEPAWRRALGHLTGVMRAAGARWQERRGDAPA